MRSITNRGRLLGLLFLLSAIAGGTGTAYRGLSGADVSSTAFLNQIVENTSSMQVAIALDMFGSAVVIFIAIFLFPLIRQLDKRLAIAYVGIAMINFVVITLSNVIHISLLSVAADFGNSATTNPAHFLTLGKMHYDAYYWVHFLMLMLYSVGGAVLYVFLFRTLLVPRWLAIWGLLASLIVFLGGALQMAEISVSILFFVQNGIFMLSFIAFLLIFGFRKNTAISETS